MRQISNTSTPRAFHPPLLAAYPILQLYVSNLTVLQLEIVLVPLVLALIAAGLVWLGFFLIMRDGLRSANITSFWILLFFSYGHVYGAIEARLAQSIDATARYAPSPPDFHWILGSLWIAGILAAPLVGERLRQEPTEVATRLLNWFGIIMIASSLAGLAIHWMQSPADDSPDRPSVSENASGFASVGYRPDIYAIVLDGYARQDTLNAHYGFSNREFIERLQSMGFQITPGSRSNYTFTYLSIPSLMNMQYVDALLDLPAHEGSNITPLIRLFRNNQLSQLLENAGYTHFHLNSTWMMTAQNPNADLELSCMGIFNTDFYRLLAETSLLRIWTKAVVDDLAQCHLHQFDRLESMGSIESPKLVFAHFIPPHYPYLFDREGRIKQQVTISDQFDFQGVQWGQKEQYLEQLQFVNSRIIQAIEKIVAESSAEPLILLLSDHGPQLRDSAGDPMPGFRDARFASFLALRTPDERLILPNDISHVNVFRYILNEYFDSNMEILDDRFYESPFNSPFDQEEVNLPDAGQDANSQSIE